MKDKVCVHCLKDLVAHHARNLRCPDGRLTIYKEKDEAIYWNPYNKVVQDHRDGTIYESATNIERAKRGLPTPWRSELGEVECRQAPSY